jgi:hypothetical protein
MMERGLVEEVRSLLAEPNGLAFTARQALGYKEMIEHLETMPPENRDKEMEKLSAGDTTDAEGRTRRRKMTQLFPELRLRKGRPKNPDK